MLTKPSSKIKKMTEWSKNNKNDLILAISFFLIAVISFGLGKLSVLMVQKEPLRVEYPQSTEFGGYISTNSEKNNYPEVRGIEAGLYVGSKNSNKYHLPDCAGALKIKEENKIWFSSKEEAESLGYIPAGNCEGI